MAIASLVEILVTKLPLAKAEAEQLAAQLSETERAEVVDLASRFAAGTLLERYFALRSSAAALAASPPEHAEERASAEKALAAAKRDFDRVVQSTPVIPESRPTGAPVAAASPVPEPAARKRK